MVAVVVSALATAWASETHACVCRERPAVADAVIASDLVIAGTVTAIRDQSADAKCKRIASTTPPLPPDILAGACGLVVTIRVDTVWKGVRTQEAAVVSGDDCAFVFKVGTRYVAFARRLKTGVLYTDRCTYTQPAAGAATFMKALGVPIWTASA